MLLLAPAATAAPFSSIRIAAYYPWFPEGWTHAQLDPFTHYRPSLGFYDAGRPGVIDRHIRGDEVGPHHLGDVLVVGQGSQTDGRFAAHLAAGAKRGFQWAIYHELEGYGDPSVESIRADLEYIRDTYAASPGYLKLGGRPVVFVYGDADDGMNCDAATRWAAANQTVGAYLVMRSFKGYRACEANIDGWHPYAANKNEFDLFPFAYSISPGFYFATGQASRAPSQRPLVVADGAPHGRLAGTVPLRDQLQRVGRGNVDRERRPVVEPIGVRPLPRRSARGSAALSR